MPTPIHGHIDRTMYGKKVTPAYDWINDPNQFKQDGHIPQNRCYHCGFKFMGSAYTAFCNICDDNMSPDGEYVYVITANDKEAKPPLKEGYWTTRKKTIMNHIRIPEDMDEKQYKEKLKQLESNNKDPLYHPEFKKASDIN